MKDFKNYDLFEVCVVILKEIFKHTGYRNSSQLLAIGGFWGIFIFPVFQPFGDSFENHVHSLQCWLLKIISP